MRGARTRNARLAAIHSLYKYAALRHPEHLQTIGRVMAIPFKRHQRPGLTYLNKDEIKALIAAPAKPPGWVAATMRCCSWPC